MQSLFLKHMHMSFVVMWAVTLESGQPWFTQVVLNTWAKPVTNWCPQLHLDNYGTCRLIRVKSIKRYHFATCKIATYSEHRETKLQRTRAHWNVERGHHVKCTPSSEKLWNEFTIESRELLILPLQRLLVSFALNSRSIQQGHSWRQPVSESWIYLTSSICPVVLKLGCWY